MAGGKCVLNIPLPQGQENNHIKWHIIVIKDSTLQNYTKSEIIDNNIIDDSYVLTYDELESMGFKLVYE